MVGRDEDAEGMAGRVGEHVERLVGIGRSILRTVRRATTRPVALLGELGLVGTVRSRWSCCGTRRVGPRRRRQLVDVLDGKARLAGAVPEHEPVLTVRVGLPGRRRLVTGSIDVAEQLSVELGDGPGVGGIQATARSAGNESGIVRCSRGGRH